MNNNKLVQLRPETSEELQELKEEISKNGGNVSISRIIRDAVVVYLRYYREQAVEKYSPFYEQENF